MFLAPLSPPRFSNPILTRSTSSADPFHTLFLISHAKQSRNPLRPHQQAEAFPPLLKLGAEDPGLLAPQLALGESHHTEPSYLFSQIATSLFIPNSPAAPPFLKNASDRSHRHHPPGHDCFLRPLLPYPPRSLGTGPHAVRGESESPGRGRGGQGGGGSGGGRDGRGRFGAGAGRGAGRGTGTGTGTGPLNLFVGVKWESL